MRMFASQELSESLILLVPQARLLQIERVDNTSVTKLPYQLPWAREFLCVSNVRLQKSYFYAVRILSS